MTKRGKYRTKPSGRTSRSREHTLGALTEEQYRDGRAKVEEWKAELDKHLGHLPSSPVDLEFAIANGDTCGQLVEIKTRMDKKSPDYETASNLLIEIGCHNRRSTRTDVPNEHPKYRSGITARFRRLRKRRNPRRTGGHVRVRGGT